jgi:hypothetical protein
VLHKPQPNLNLDYVNQGEPQTSAEFQEVHRGSGDPASLLRCTQSL